MPHGAGPGQPGDRQVRQPYRAGDGRGDGRRLAGWGGEPCGVDPASPPPVRGAALGLLLVAEPGQRDEQLIAGYTEPTGDNVRVDAGYAAGSPAPPADAPVLAMLSTWGADPDRKNVKINTKGRNNAKLSLSQTICDHI